MRNTLTNLFAWSAEQVLLITHSKYTSPLAPSIAMKGYQQVSALSFESVAWPTQRKSMIMPSSESSQLTPTIRSLTHLTAANLQSKWHQRGRCARLRYSHSPSGMEIQRPTPLRLCQRSRSHATISFTSCFHSKWVFRHPTMSRVVATTWSHWAPASSQQIGNLRLNLAQWVAIMSHGRPSTSMLKAW